MFEYFVDQVLYVYVLAAFQRLYLHMIQLPICSAEVTGNVFRHGHSIEAVIDEIVFHEVTHCLLQLVNQPLEV